MSHSGPLRPPVVMRAIGLTLLTAVLVVLSGVVTVRPATAATPAPLGVIANVSCNGDTVGVTWTLTGLLSVPVTVAISSTTGNSPSNGVTTPTTPLLVSQTVPVIYSVATINIVATPQGGSPVTMTGNQPLSCLLPVNSALLRFNVNGQATCSTAHGAWIIQLQVQNTGSASISLPAGWVPTLIPPSGVSAMQLALAGSAPSPYTTSVLATAGTQTQVRDVAVDLPGLCSVAVPPGAGPYPPNYIPPPTGYPPGYPPGTIFLPPGWIALPPGTLVGYNFPTSPTQAPTSTLAKTGPGDTRPLMMWAVGFLVLGFALIITARLAANEALQNRVRNYLDGTTPS